MSSFENDQVKSTDVANANQVETTEASAAIQPPPFQFKSSDDPPVQGFGLDDVYSLGKGALAGTGVTNIMSGLNMLSNSQVAKAIPGVNILTGAYDAANSESGILDRVAGGARGIGGVTGLLGSLGMLPTVGSLGGAAATGAGATAAGGAFAGAGAAATSIGALLGAGAAGWGVGRGLDKLVGWGMDATGASDALDRSKGISRPEGQHGDYSLSGMMGDGMHAQDQALTSVMRATGLYDDSAPAYTQTIGWKLAEVLPSWMQ